MLFCASPLVEGRNPRHILPDSRDLHTVLPVMLSQVMIGQLRAVTCGISFVLRRLGFVTGRASRPIAEDGTAAACTLMSLRAPARTLPSPERQRRRRSGPGPRIARTARRSGGRGFRLAAGLLGAGVLGARMSRA
jgi:hypothetical protein